MFKTFIFLIIVLNFQSCSLFMSKKERLLQTDILAKLSSQSANLAKCTKNSNLFKIFDKKRIRVVIFLSINSRGQIKRFNLDDKLYPVEYAECVFKVVDLVNFPKLDNGEVIELKQPFIFSYNN